MTIEQKVSACIAEIKEKGFYIINEELNEATFEFIYKVQKSGEYFLDLTPDGVYQPKKWVLRDDPKYAMRQSVIETNQSVDKHENRVLILTLISVGILIATFVKDCNNKTEERLQDIEKAILKQDTSLQQLAPAVRDLIPSIERITPLTKDTIK